MTKADLISSQRSQMKFTNPRPAWLLRRFRCISGQYSVSRARGLCTRVFSRRNHGSCYGTFNIAHLATGGGASVSCHRTSPGPWIPALGVKKESSWGPRRFPADRSDSPEAHATPTSSAADGGPVRVQRSERRRCDGMIGILGSPPSLSTLRRPTL
jgi:hypothetical protein